MAERLRTTYGQAHLEFRWSAGPVPDSRQAIVEDVTDDSEEATATQCRGSVTVADNDTPLRQRHATEDQDDRFNKRAHLQENDIVAASIGSVVGSSRGHSYQHVLVTDNASVLMGDQHIVNNNYSDPFEGINILLQRFWDADPDERDAIVYLAASVIAVAVLHVMVQRLFHLIGRLHPAAPGAMKQRMPSLLSRIGYRFAIFEDAFGRVKTIDIDILTDWSAFHEELTKDFKNKPGHRRVAGARYRLFDQAYSDCIIDPRNPPPFATLFRPKAHVLMSVHFAWDEVSLECCPKCGLKQTCELEKETKCQAVACGFSYRGHVQDPTIVELDDDADAAMSREDRASMGTSTEQRTKSRRQRLKNEQENPVWFSRISVSRQPEEISVPKFGTSPTMGMGSMSRSGLGRGSFVRDG